MNTKLDPPEPARKGLPLLALGVLATIAILFAGFLIHSFVTAY